MDILNLFRDDKDDFEVPTGETLFKEGDPGDHMYVIRSGEMDMIIDNRIFMTLQAGDLFGEMALVDDKPRSATAKARSDCRIIVVDEKRFNFLVQQAPTFALHMMRTLVSRLRRMNQIIDI